MHKILLTQCLLSPSDLQGNFQWRCYSDSWSPVCTDIPGFFFLSQMPDTALIVAELLEVSGSPALQNIPRSLWMVLLPPPVLGNTSQGPFQSAGSSTLQLLQWICFCSCLLCGKNDFFFQNTGSTTMAAMWIEESCCWPAFRLLLLNSPTEEKLIKVSLDASIWGTYYCTGKIANNWRAMKTLSRTDRKEKRPTN